MLNLKNDRLLKAIRRESVDRTPIWVMRQAGRYLPEYRAIRAQAGSFMTLCKTPELACEVTLQPLQRYAFDAAIIFSDILTIPDAMGLELSFVEGEGPKLAQPVRLEADIKKLHVPDLEKLNYVYDAIGLVQKELKAQVPLIGFCGSPWTLAAYMVEGQSVPNFPRLQKMRQEAPDLLHKLLNVLAESVAAHLKAQIQAGVQVVMIFDTWGSMLSDTPSYEEFSLNYIKQSIRALKAYYTEMAAPVILFAKGGRRSLEAMVQVGCDGVGVDWEIELKEARRRIGDKVAIQGNMNPACLLTTEQGIIDEVKRVLASYGHGSGHVFNLGHGITPDVPPDHVSVLVDAVHQFSKAYHAEKNLS